jgi:hypothetical protein
VPTEPLVIMYSRRRCGLCDEARQVILNQRRLTPFRFEESFIDGNDLLEARYGLRVPVVEVNGVEEFEFVVDPRRLGELVGTRAPDR